jgi:pimeloyl-ACP methyl ester carboxylesterase
MTTSTRTWVRADDGVRLAVDRWPAAASNAPLVLGLHGITANRLGFLPLLDELGGEVEFVAFDCRGRGLSDKPEDPAAYGHRRHAEDAAAVLAAIGRRADVVVGQSMGAWDGLQLAAHHPDLVGALVLADGGYFADLPEGLTPDTYVASVMGPGWLERLAMVFPSKDVLFEALRALPPFREIWDEHLEALFAAGLEELPDGRVRNRCLPLAAKVDSEDYFAPAAAPYVRTDLARVVCPVHLARAERGFDISPETAPPLIPESAVEQFQRALPQLTVETVPDSNHYSLNFGPQGVKVLAEAVRKALR